jgi:hypothetical protein
MLELGESRQLMQINNISSQVIEPRGPAPQEMARAVARKSDCRELLGLGTPDALSKGRE